VRPDPPTPPGRPPPPQFYMRHCLVSLCPSARGGGRPTRRAPRCARRAAPPGPQPARSAAPLQHWARARRGRGTGARGAARAPRRARRAALSGPPRAPRAGAPSGARAEPATRPPPTVIVRPNALPARASPRHATGNRARARRVPRDEARGLTGSTEAPARRARGAARRRQAGRDGKARCRRGVGWGTRCCGQQAPRHAMRAPQQRACSGAGATRGVQGRGRRRPAPEAIVLGAPRCLAPPGGGARGRLLPPTPCLRDLRAPV
jgi:hypothetical protein